MRALRRAGELAGAAGRACARGLRVVPRPSLNDAIEAAGLGLIGWGLSYVHIGIALGVVGLYLLVVANVRSDGASARARRGGRQ